MVEVRNIFRDKKASVGSEVVDILLETGGLRMERIVSTGQATPAGQWYDQEKDEWVMVLSGRAGLLFEGDEKARTMGPGDYLLIPAHARHRVEWTAQDMETIWLAIHIRR